MARACCEQWLAAFVQDVFHKGSEMIRDTLIAAGVAANVCPLLCILFKGPPAGAAAQRFFEIFEKNAFFEKLVKIGFLTLFGMIWA